MQDCAGQEARSSPGSARGEGIPIESPERPSPVLPFARVVFYGIRHANTGGERRKDNRGRPKCLVGVDRKFIAEGDSPR
jgi:hypothetical protein